MNGPTHRLMRLGYLIFIAAVAAFCRGLLPLRGGDWPVYAAALCWAAIAAVLSRGKPRQALGHLLLILNIAYWSCFLALPEAQWRLTEQLRHVKALLLVAVAALEVGGALVLIKGYRRARRDLMLFPAEAFLHSLRQFPMPGGLLKLFSMEFNIWSALASRVWRCPPFARGTYAPLSRLDSGYSGGLLAGGSAAALAIIAFSAWLLPGWWPLVPTLLVAYLALLMHCDVLAFRGDAVFLGQGAMVIANGVHGMLRVPLGDIQRIESLPGTATSEGAEALKAHRLAAPNVQVALSKPLDVFGISYSRILLKATDVASLKEAIHA